MALVTEYTLYENDGEFNRVTINHASGNISIGRRPLYNDPTILSGLLESINFATLQADVYAVGRNCLRYIDAQDLLDDPALIRAYSFEQEIIINVRPRN